MNPSNFSRADKINILKQLQKGKSIHEALPAFPLSVLETDPGVFMVMDDEMSILGTAKSQSQLETVMKGVKVNNPFRTLAVKSIDHLTFLQISAELEREY